MIGVGKPYLTFKAPESGRCLRSFNPSWYNLQPFYLCIPVKYIFFTRTYFIEVK